jgi:hypothetical protein
LVALAGIVNEHLRRSSPDNPTGALRAILLLRRFSGRLRLLLAVAIWSKRWDFGLHSEGRFMVT